MFQQILVAIDHSSVSQQVFEQALTIAQANQAHLILLHVLSIEESDNASGESSSQACRHLSCAHQGFGYRWKTLNRRGIQLLRAYAHKAIAAGIQTEYSLIEGLPGSTICEFAHACYADMIVIGCREDPNLSLMLLGRVTSYVLHHAPCSVFLVDTPSSSPTVNQQAETVTAYV